MILNLDNIVSRFDTDIFQVLLGEDVVSILNKIDSKHLYSASIVRVLKNSFSNEELLRNKTSRDFIIDSLKESEVKALGEKFNIKSNYYVGLKELKYNKENIEILFVSFDEAISEKEIVKWNLEDNIEPLYPLYPYQRNVLGKVKRILETSNNRVLLHMPTGSGKTRTAINYICNHLLENEDKNVVWFANTVELLDQAYDEFLEAWKLLGNRSIRAVKFWGDSNIDLSSCKGSFIVAGLDKTYNSLLKDASKMSIFSNNCSLVIMDEAHQAIAPTYELLLNSLLVVNKAALIGLSATPGRTWNDPEEDKKLANFFYKQKVKIEIEGYDNPVDYLVEMGYLAKTINTTLLNNSGIKLSARDLDYLNSNGVLSPKVLKELSEDVLRNLVIISKIQKLVLKHQRIIVFAITKAHAIFLNSILAALEINSKVLTSDTSASDRIEIIEAFKISREDNPESLVLCNYGILTTGFDAPEISCAVIARPTDSLVLYSQMVGRAIRGERSGGNKEAEIVTVVDENLPGFGNVADAFTNWDDVWDDIN
ncbi:DEAD/DEAH box helicase [Myroides sp. LJL115]